MSELYGTPVGSIAADREGQQSLLSGLGALKTLGEIDQQPAEKALKEAHARLFGSQADLEATKVLEARRQLQNAADWQKERAARDALSQGKSAQGQLATINDLPPGGKLTASRADQIDQYIDFLRNRGEPEEKMIPLVKEASLIRQQEGAAAHNQAQAVEQATRARGLQASQDGAAAVFALKGPQQYAIVRAQRIAAGLPVTGMPESFEQARPILEGIRDQAVSVEKRLELDRKEAHDKKTDALQEAQRAATLARIPVLKARAEYIRKQVDVLGKNNGPDSPDVQRAKEGEAAADKALRDARLNLTYPPLPLAIGDVKNGQAYTLKNGARGRAVVTGGGVFGGPVSVAFEELTPAPGSAKAAALLKARTKTKFGRSLIPADDLDSEEE